MKNLTKKYGITEESLKQGIDIVAKNLGLIVDAKVMFAVAELLADGDIKPSNADLKYLIEEALKDYRGDNKVVITTSRGGSVCVEDFDENSLILENNGLETEVLELRSRNAGLEITLKGLYKKIEKLERIKS